VFAPWSDVPGLQEAIDALRSEGNIVICQLPGQKGGAADMNCDRELLLEHGRWITKKVSGARS
jgi:ATP phosphoribosyltransferase regulatory subunit